jgi:hypothetical protein
MQEDPSKIISQFLAQLESHNVTSMLFKQFLIALQILPLDLPLLQVSGKFFSGEADNIVTKYIFRRCRRINVVQQSLEKINFSKAKPENRFEDFIFQQTDFSLYEKIDAETFSFFYIDGIDDLSDEFYIKNCFREKSEIRKIISARYKLIDGFYVSDGNPLIIPIMRSIHTSLDFIPFPHQHQFINELESVFEFLNKNAGLPEIFFQYLTQEEDDLFCTFLHLFNNTIVLHNNNTIVRFFIGKEKNKYGLFAVFNPEEKAFTKLMTISKVPFSEHKE